MGMERTVQSELWPHQVEAVDAVTTAIGSGGRTSLIGACGIGKTRIGGAVVAEIAATGRVLVAASGEDRRGPRAARPPVLNSCRSPR